MSQSSFHLKTIATALCAWSILSIGFLAAAEVPISDSTPATPPGWVTIKSKGMSFEMGQEFAGHRWTYTYPVHPVAFTYDFVMSPTAVTQAEFKTITGKNPTLHPGDEQRPIDNVSWFDAVIYCNALSERDGLAPVYSFLAPKRDSAGNVTELPNLNINIKNPGYRLLTSAEFEYVQRAGTQTRWFFGDKDEDQIKATEFAWCDRNSEKTTHPVGKLKPNSYGIYDMTGNLWMWCNDWYDGAYPTARQTDPSGPSSGEERIARGGAFKNDVNHERSAYHWQWTPGSHNFEVGFRIARTIPTKPDSPLKFSDINEETWYRIIAVSSGKTLEIKGTPADQQPGLQLQQNKPTGLDNQLFRFKRVQSGYYQIFVKHSGEVLQIRDASLLDHAQVEQGADSGQDHQLFTLVKDTNEAYSIIVKSSGYGFDVSGGVGAIGNEVPIIVYPSSDALNHKFKIVEASLADFKPVVLPLSEISPYHPPFDAAIAGLTSLFDGQTLKGWVGDPNGWKVENGQIVGVKDNQNLMTDGDYDDFRLIVSTIQVDSPSNHQGIGFWGERMPAGTYGYGGCIDVMPPMNWTWDYSTNHGAKGILKVNRDIDKEYGVTRSEWTQAEILVNRAKGTIRMAVNGIEVLNYTDRNPARLKRGPIGLQAHGGNKNVRYKDIFIEVAPKQDRLITLKP